MCDFDDFFSNMIAEDYDKNHDQKLESSEVAVIKKEAFSHLVEYDYFSFIKIDSNSFKVKYVTDFQARLQNGKLTYSFFIPCHIKASSGFKKITISQYDPSYYSAVCLSKQHPVIIENGKKFDTRLEITENKDETYYYGMVHPVEAVITFRIKDE